MKKYTKKIFTFLLVFTLVFGISGLAAPKVADAWVFDYLICAVRDGGFDCALRGLVTGLMEGVLGIAGIITGLAGVMLNGVVYHTVVNVADNYANLMAINSAWTAVRDLANMVFIFLLLYAAIRIILGWGDDSKRLIVHIIIVAILINFSLFFTKVVIDASNILALFFYGAISPSASVNDFSLDPGSTSLADQFMSRLELTNLYNVGEVETSTIFIMGVMGTIMLMVAAFVFFSVTIMFIVRYVVLIFVLILSPLAFLSYVFPALRRVGNKWLDTLIGQAFFAPIYFMITWIALRVLGDVARFLGIDTGDLSDVRNSISQIATAEAGQLTIEPFMVVLNFLIVIVFLVASLSIAKSWANRAGGGAAKANKWLTGAAVGGAVGGAAWLGRQTVGRGATWVAENEKLKQQADAGSRSARLALWAGRKGGTASFDVRNTGLRGAMGVEAPKTKKGYEGFVGGRKAYAEKQAKVAESYAPSEKAKTRAQGDYDEAVNKFGAESFQAIEAKKKRDQILGNKEEVEKNVKTAESEKQKDLESKKEKGKQAMANLENKEKIASQTVATLESELAAADFGVKVEKLKELDIARDKLQTLKKEKQALKDKIRDEAEFVERAYDTQIETIKRTEVQSADKVRKEAFAKRMQNSVLGKLRGYNYAAAAQVRKGSKSAKDKLTEAAKEYSEELEGGTKDTTPPPAPPPPSRSSTPTP